MQKSFYKAGALALFLGMGSSPLWIGKAATVFHVDAGIVVVSFTVKDDLGNYVSKLKPSQIVVREDNVPQTVQSFMEATSPVPSAAAAAPESPLISSSVFVLFDTSNCMYDGFARHEDEIESFIRNLDPKQAVAVYSFSHNLSRLARLTHDHEEAIRGLRSAAAGDSTALLNATLLTLRDAAQVPGRKIIVVFSNGPDDTSMVSPDQVAHVAEEEGVPIYIISAKAHDQICQNAFDLLSGSSGGKMFQAAQRATQVEAFHAISEDMLHTYTLTYTPLPNENLGWRHITVQVLGEAAKTYKVESRTGYWPIRNSGD